ncbi:hypothetical protein Q4Q34_08845 [Flavivirga abyssicola]|uniref:hypothetical protein n=1 Tax=Flavivirga abyssicola TaxID=3063533 RepID=UPI0026E0983D|nr:hypothetical protein [Flavivirga sp. MEBiC07777]WVK15134.1 hypothetical protein Q4Q34_08845 [Flavivirga sp. MEBiC07777]
MKKTIKLIIVLVLMMIAFNNCSETKDAIDTLNNLECLEKLTRYSNNEDDLTCSEQISQLQSLKNSCPDDDGSIQTLINLLVETCED